VKQSTEDLKKRDSEYILRTRFSVIRALLIFPFRINEVKKNKGIRMSPGLAYLKMVKGERYIVKN
jgi:hypothetical protein